MRRGSLSVQRVLTVIGAVAACAGHAWGEDLRPRWEKDTERYYVRRVDFREVTRLDMEGGGEVPERHVTSEVGLKLKVLDSQPEGLATVECTVLYIDRAEVQGEESTTFDSRKGPGGKKANWTTKVRQYLNKPFKLNIDKSGAVAKVEGLPALGKSNYNPFEDLFSESAFQRLPMFATGGAGANAKAGAHWTQKFEQDLAMSDSRLTEEVAFIIDKLGEEAHISFKSQYGSASRELSTEEAAKAMKVKDVQGGREGKIVWDVGEGDCKEFRCESKLSLTQGMPGAEAMGLKVERHLIDALKPAKLEDFHLRPAPAAKAKPEAKKADEGKENGESGKDDGEEGRGEGEDDGDEGAASPE